MLRGDGSFDFAPELMRVVEEFLTEYEAINGPLQDDLQKGLVISYVLGTLRCDLEAIWDCLASNDAFGQLHPRKVFEDCAQNVEWAEKQSFAINQELRKRGWLNVEAPSQSADAANMV